MTTATETRIAQLEARIAQLEAIVNKPAAQSVEMTDEMAKRILNGDLASLKHKEAAEKLGLTYGQIYSCRLEFTFKQVHKELKAAGWKNSWAK